MRNELDFIVDRVPLSPLTTKDNR